MIHSSVTCPLADCPKKDECARHSFYLKALAESDSFSVLNTTRFQSGPDGCEHFIVPVHERHAYGFRRLYSTIPVGNARYMNWGVCFGSDSTYYRTKRGERPLTPAQQQFILQQVQKAGGNPTVGFDRYEDVIVYRKG